MINRKDSSPESHREILDAFKRDQSLSSVVVGGDDMDAIMIRQLEAQGSDLREPRDVQLKVFMPTSATSKLAAETLERDGFEVVIDTCSEGGFLLTAEMNGVVIDLPVMLALRAKVRALAQKHGGRYDGWCATI